MENYVEQNLGKNESIVRKAELNSLALVAAWISGVLFCWLLFIPTIKAIIKTVQFFHIELAVTSRRVVGKTGVLHTQTLDAPLNKIQNVAESKTFGGKIFNTFCLFYVKQPKSDCHGCRQYDPDNQYPVQF